MRICKKPIGSMLTNQSSREENIAFPKICTVTYLTVVCEE